MDTTSTPGSVLLEIASHAIWWVPGFHADPVLSFWVGFFEAMYL